MISKVLHSFLVILLVMPIIFGQSSKEPSTTAAEGKKAREEREKKALALVDEIIRDSESLSLPENKVRIDIALADSLWPRDEKRARLLFKQAVSSFTEIDPDRADAADRDYALQLTQQLRNEILQVAGNHDARLALEFLRSSRPASPPLRRYWQPDYESQLEMRLAMQLSEKDPKEALSIAEDSMKLGMNQEVTSLLYNLYSRDKTAAATLLNDIVERIGTGESSKSQAAPYIALSLLRSWIESNKQTAEQPQARLPNLNADTARELSGIIIKTVLNTGTSNGNNGAIVLEGEGLGVISYPGQLLGMIQQLKPMLADVEKLSPAEFPALNKRIAEFDKFNEANQGPWAKYQQLYQTGTAEDMLQAAKTAPPEVSESLLHQAAWKAIGQGDADIANRIMEKISDPQQRRQMELNLARRSFERAQSEKKLSEARALLSRFPPEEQVVLLAQMATSIAHENKQMALGLMSEAEALLGNRALNYQQLGAQLQLASSYEQIDPGRDAALVQKAINQINELVVAALVLNGFDLQQYFRGGELVIKGGNSLSEIARQTGERLGSLSRSDFDRAKSVAEEFQRPELRLMALLQIAQTALTKDYSEKD